MISIYRHVHDKKKNKCFSYVLIGSRTHDQYPKNQKYPRRNAVFLVASMYDHYSAMFITDDIDFANSFYVHEEASIVDIIYRIMMNIDYDNQWTIELEKQMFWQDVHIDYKRAMKYFIESSLWSITMNQGVMHVGGIPIAYKKYRKRLLKRYMREFINAAIIQRTWRRVIADPQYCVCLKRLQNEFYALQKNADYCDIY